MPFASASRVTSPLPVRTQWHCLLAFGGVPDVPANSVGLSGPGERLHLPGRTRFNGLRSNLSPGRAGRDLARQFFLDDGMASSLGAFVLTSSIPAAHIAQHSIQYEHPRSPTHLLSVA